METTSGAALNSTRDFSREALFASLGGGVLAVFGALGWQGAYGAWPLAAAALITAALIALSLRRYLPSNQGDAASAHATERGRYLLITRLEYLGFIVALVGCTLLRQMNWALPLIVIIAGVHYFALGRLLGSPAAYGKGALLCILALVTILFIPQVLPNQTDALDPVLWWWVIPGIGGTIILWADAIGCLILAARS